MINDWNDFFNSIKRKDYYLQLKDFLDKEYSTKNIYPPRELLFNAFNLVSPCDIKVVILGQDPYHNKGEAMGLSFSVPSNVKLPPSLRNIFKEIDNDLNIKMKSDGDLTYLTKQGVFLINAYLSVEENKPLSHKIKEYDLLMKDLFCYIDSLKQPIVFMFWGGFAKKYKKYIKNEKHFVIETNHPSPLSANRGGWFNQHAFSRCNTFLNANNISPIHWDNN